MENSALHTSLMTAIRTCPANHWFSPLCTNSTCIPAYASGWDPTWTSYIPPSDLYNSSLPLRPISEFDAPDTSFSLSSPSIRKTPWAPSWQSPSSRRADSNPVWAPALRCFDLLPSTQKAIYLVIAKHYSLVFAPFFSWPGKPVLCHWLMQRYWLRILGYCARVSTCHSILVILYSEKSNSVCSFYAARPAIATLRNPDRKMPMPWTAMGYGQNVPLTE